MRPRTAGSLEPPLRVPGRSKNDVTSLKSPLDGIEDDGDDNEDDVDDLYHRRLGRRTQDECHWLESVLLGWTDDRRYPSALLETRRHHGGRRGVDPACSCKNTQSADASSSIGASGTRAVQRDGICS